MMMVSNRCASVVALLAVINIIVTCQLSSPHNDDGDDDNKPVWPTWAVGALFRSVRRYNGTDGYKKPYTLIRYANK
jgi:hypothetical protein